MKFINKIYNDKEFMSVAKPIFTHNEFLKTKSIVHHGNTRYNHSVRVSYIAYKLAKILGCDVTSTIRGGALHDFFLVRDDKNILTSAKMFVEHPTIAKENAIKYFAINEKEQNIIEAHMFPTSSVLPKSKEAWIVTIADKISAVLEGATQVKTQIGVWMLFLVNFIR